MKLSGVKQKCNLELSKCEKRLMKSKNNMTNVYICTKDSKDSLTTKIERVASPMLRMKSLVNHWVRTFTKDRKLHNRKYFREQYSLTVLNYQSK